MARKVFAVSNIKIDSDTTFAAGTEVDHSRFTKEQLKQLHDDGAIEVRDSADEVSKGTEAEKEKEEDAEDTNGNE